jgi:hypothetical protein
MLKRIFGPKMDNAKGNRKICTRRSFIISTPPKIILE